MVEGKVCCIFRFVLVCDTFEVIILISSSRFPLLSSIDHPAEFLSLGFLSICILSLIGNLVVVVLQSILICSCCHNCLVTR
ncbi:hypothetical protein BGZ60DRAFT_404358 [Tricladium varicosporioides]|nr:hypothetical protein BGZ60DRAFT_404358 [Hymenoscyphus varicosporioides]